jgi:hypothetical protein
MNMVKLIFATSRRLFRLRLVLGLIATAFIVTAAVTPPAADKMDDSPDLVLYNGRFSRSTRTTRPSKRLRFATGRSSREAGADRFGR